MNNTLFSIMRHRVNKFVSVRNSNIFEILKSGRNFDAIFLNANILFILEGDSFQEETYHVLNSLEYITHKYFFKKISQFQREEICEV